VYQHTDRLTQLKNRQIGLTGLHMELKDRIDRNGEKYWKQNPG
jgi:hypothetical protein